MWGGMSLWNVQGPPLHSGDHIVQRILTVDYTFKIKISIKLVHHYMVIFFNFSATSNRLHPLQVGNCDSNSRLVVDEDDNGKFRLERVK